jgi:RNA polymerase sigma-70 factor (ECF subfamily)
VEGEGHEALGELYRRHGAAVWSVAKRVCRSTELAQDVCETVFSELWSRPERFDPARGELRPWLVAEAHSRAVEAARSGAATAPSAEVDSEALSGDARRALDKLAPVERDAILLTYVGGHACSEAARLLGVSEDVVKSSVRRGLLNLRRAQEAEGVSR